MILFEEQFKKTKGYYYLYALVRPDKNGEYFYIGYGKNKRIFHHFTQHKIRKNNPYKCNIIDKLIRNGYKIQDVGKILLVSDNEDYIKQMEISMISKIGRYDLGKGPLSNMTNGGDGSIEYHHSEESRKKISLTSKGRKFSEETKRMMSINRTGNKNHRYGKKFSPETCAKISKTRLRKAVIGTNLETNETIFFSSIRDACKHNFFHVEKIIKGIYKQSNGYVFRYATSEEIERYSTIHM